MNIDEIIKSIAIPGTEKWHCYDTLRSLLSSNKELKEIISNGIIEGEIHGFGEDLWYKLDSQNIRARGVNSFLEVLRDGYNQGYCTVAAKQVSFSLNNCYICGGVLPILKNTTNCKDGSHTWIEQSDWIIDTTLMLFIKTNLKDLLGYNEENRYNPEMDSLYSAAKSFANDSSLRKIS